MNTRLPRLLLTAGEPAGIGPDLCLAIAQREWPAQLVCIADPTLLKERAAMLGAQMQLIPWDESLIGAHVPATLPYIAVSRLAPTQPGKLDSRNAEYVLETLKIAARECVKGHFDAMITGPVHKSVINDAGYAFSGHTEFLAAETGGSIPLMMLAAGNLRVVLATTHMPLRDVADAITPDMLAEKLRILHRELQQLFGIDKPRIRVCGLNPHAGEDGHLGHEDNEIIRPVVAQLNAIGHDIDGPLPADTAFNNAGDCDAIMAMYHDQGLPVLKYAGFGTAVNVTLGLPVIRTSVDHGTALDLAGSGRAEPGSMIAATELALEIVRKSGTRIPDSATA